MNKLVIFGNSGFAREVADIAYDQGYEQIVFAVQSSPGKQEILESSIGDLKESCDFALGIGDGKVREYLYLKYKDLNFVNLIHSTATFGRNQRKELESSIGVVVAAGVRFTNSIEVGDFAVINLSVTIGHDSKIGAFASFMPGAHISGNVHVNRCAYVGTGAVILQGESPQNPMLIGVNAVVGAGAVVTKNVSANTTVAGIPAKHRGSTY